jgi:uncharacterized membrane protein
MPGLDIAPWDIAAWGAAVREWTLAMARWLHLVVAMAWIGASFYMMRIEGRFARAGEAWLAHGGRFRQTSPATPDPTDALHDLIWIRFEAYATWGSGFALLILIYYVGADLYLIDRNVLDLPSWAAIALSFGSLILGWIVYDRLCRSHLGANDRRLALVGLVLLAAVAFLFGQIFAARGAFLHVGALIGTVMVANVAHVITPAQRSAIKAVEAGEAVDPALAEEAERRLLHNNHLALPVALIMISGHHPMIYASRWNWLIIALLLIVGVAIRLFFNARHAGGPSPWRALLVAAGGALGVLLLSWPASETNALAEAHAQGADPVAAAEALDIIERRCAMCHAADPAFAGVAAPPMGVVLETPADIVRHAQAIRLQTTLTCAMPPANVTEMTEAERKKLAAWLRRAPE